MSDIVVWSNLHLGQAGRSPSSFFYVKGRKTSNSTCDHTALQLPDSRTVDCLWGQSLRSMFPVPDVRLSR
ncbi:hypothetical protein PISMIDRAFT_176545 [Pisolithus microcarpus 441]|uniref:Uncharacterized protein n=1 Tax=Pisolithus microcarpus 441 TaxID=765257 RepID=A0A0C9ZFV7_9AGAM|nr:hypothetical protein PISMIDRAFT_176545 [Pisolithus microcarpus 441]